MIFNSRLFRRYQTVWTRSYLTSRYEGIGTAEEAFSLFYFETSDFGEQLQIFFGRANANTYANLLNEFSIGIEEMITAQLRRDTEAVQRAVDRLYRNTEERAAFLASINPYFNESQLQSMFAEYLRLTIEEANAFASHNYERDIATYDQLIALSDRIGYVFAEGLYDYITSGGEYVKDVETEECLTFEQMNAIYFIKMLWFDIITWTRSHMLSIVENVGNEEEIHMRLKLAADASSDAVRLIFGEEAGNASELHINLFIDLMDQFLDAQMEGDIEKVNESTRLLYQEAHAHAQFLASLNPAWEESIWDVILYDIVQNLINMSTALLEGNYTLQTDIFSSLLARAEEASKYLGEGIYQYIISQRKP
ncbi:MAG: hypothetical protein PHE79_09055 [Eubacteriales bacterium]|nr:hypothetical protein [Eubacteriales bacterium]